MGRARIFPLSFRSPVSRCPRSYKRTHILRSSTSDEVQALLDEHIVKGQTMLASRFAKPLSEKIKQWVDSLILIQDVLEAWLKCQATYLYLDPIFSSEDIMQQMPDEGVKFRTVHEMWCDVMKLAHAQPLAFPAMRQEDLLERLNEANAELESIMREEGAGDEVNNICFIENSVPACMRAQMPPPMVVQQPLE